MGLVRLEKEIGPCGETCVYRETPNAGAWRRKGVRSWTDDPSHTPAARSGLKIRTVEIDTLAVMPSQAIRRVTSLGECLLS